MSTLQERIEAAFKDEINTLRGYTMPFGKNGMDMFDHILNLLERDTPSMAKKHAESEMSDEQRTRYAYGDADCPRCGLPKPKTQDVVDAFSEHLDRLYDSFDDDMHEQFYDGFLRAGDEVAVNLKYFIDGTLPKPELPDDDPRVQRIAKALWESDGYDLDNDPNSSTARELYPEFFRRARAVIAAEDNA